MKIEFYKYQGTGNDFIILDNRTGLYDSINNKQVAKLCDRKFGIGADGLMLMNSKEGFDFEMKYFNADGNQSSMCGNGGRCMVQFAYHMGIHNYTYRFLAVDGLHEAEIDNKKEIKLKMKDVTALENSHHHFILNTGSPHFVTFVTDILNVDVFESYCY